MSNDKISERGMRIGSDMIELRGDLAAEIAYNNLSEGAGFPDAFRRLRPIVAKVEAGEEGPEGKNDRRPLVDLLWAFSATWRRRNGWNKDDDTRLPYDERESYFRLIENLSTMDSGPILSKVFPLLVECFQSPSKADPNEAQDRPEA